MTYWGSDRVRPDFSLLVDGSELVKEQLEGRPRNKFFDVEYALPVELTHGKSKIRIRVQPHESHSGPSVSGARIVLAK